MRSYTLKDDRFEISDKYELKSRVLADTLNFLLHGEVFLPGTEAPGGILVKEGEIVAVNGSVKVKMSYPKSLVPSLSVKELADPRLTGIWGPVLRRLSFTAPADAPLKGQYRFTVTRL